MKIAIVKYGMGNVASVQKAIAKIGFNSIITNDFKELENSDIILLPGVGSFKKGMDNLKELGLDKLLTKLVLQNNKPFIGICLGMQLIAKIGHEPEINEGLNWIDGEVELITTKTNYRVPHLGWNNILIENQHEEFSEFNNQDFYFIHSYHFKVENDSDIWFKVKYDNDLVAAIQKNNIYAMQFHPEKSQEVGLNLLKKIIEKYA